MGSEMCIRDSAAPLPTDMQPIKAGMSGGRYKPLTDTDMARIHEAALRALEEIGLCDAPPSGVDYMVAAGAIYGADKRLRFPRALVETMLGKAQKSLTLHGRDPLYDLLLSGTRVHYGTAGQRFTSSMCTGATTANRPCKTCMTPPKSCSKWTISTSCNARSWPAMSPTCLLYTSPSPRDS